MNIVFNRRIALVLAVLLNFAHVTNAATDCSGRHSNCPEEENVIPRPPPPTASPTASPSSTPSESSVTVTGSSFGCVTNNNGFFGTTSDESMDVEFKYALEYNPDGIFKAIRDDLEGAFNDEVLPELFDECETTISRKLNKALSSIVGISTGREDTILEGVACTKTKPENNCAVMSGSIFVFFEEDYDKTSAANVPNVIRDVLKSSMDAGSFDDAHPAIERVSYVSQNVTFPGPSDGDPPQGNITARDGDGNSGLIYGIFGLVGGLAIIVLALAWRQKEKKRRAAEEEEEGVRELEHGSFPSSPSSHRDEVV